LNTSHVVETVANGCKVKMYFSKTRNDQVVKNILENLLDTFENRITVKIYD